MANLLTAQSVLNGTYSIGDIIRLHIVYSDIALSQCGNRRRCILALAFNRQLNLRGAGYITADANEVAFTTIHGDRVHMVVPKSAVTYLRKYDKIGEVEGQAAAITKTKPTDFGFKVYDVNKIPAPASRERKDRINELRNARDAARRKLGLIKKPSRRYAGV